MAINPMLFMQLKTSWNRFVQNHPKFPQFLKAAYSHGLAEGSIVEFKITTPEGKTISSNIKLSREDMDTIHLFQELIKNG